MRIAVCAKAVPDAASGARLDPATKRLDRSGDLALSEYDAHALEEALRLRDAAGEGEVGLLSMGPPKAMDALRKGLAMGADRAVLVSDEALAGSDLVATSKALAAALARVGARSRALRPAVGGRQRCVPLGGGRRAARAAGRLAGGRAERRRRHADGEATDRVRLRDPPRAAARGRRRLGRDQRAALPVAQGDHGGEVEAAGGARRGCDRRRGAERDRGARRSSRPRRARRASASRARNAAAAIVDFLAERRLL